MCVIFVRFCDNLARCVIVMSALQECNDVESLQNLDIKWCMSLTSAKESSWWERVIASILFHKIECLGALDM